MNNNVFLINKLSQIKALGSQLSLQIINELILNPATCQQLSEILGLSKQKIHYTLKKLSDIGLIEIVKIPTSDKEIYYKSIAKNYIIDFSLGTTINKINQMNNRELINTILETDYNINLSQIAANFLDNSLKMKPKEKLLIDTGEYNMPLVKKILVEAAKRQIETTLLYHDNEMIKAKNDLFSLAAYNADFKKFEKLLKVHNVYLNLNGESRLVPLNDPKKRKLQQKSFLKCQEIIRKNKIKTVIMQGLINDSILEKNIISEVNFWKSLDIDYQKLADETREMAKKFSVSDNIFFKTDLGSDFNLKVEKIICEYGSFTNLPLQSPIVNIPGGEILIIPKKDSMNGIIKAKDTFLYGKKISNLTLNIKNNEITDFTASENKELINRIIYDGGKDGKKIALICIGTNYNMNGVEIDISFRNKSKGNVSIYWGDNISLGGNVHSNIEWQIQLNKPTIIVKKGVEK